MVDGSGLPARVADVGIRDGRIVEIGRLGDAAEVIDADGLVVMPGIVDHHTHYDPQLCFDPCATPSCLHGVTTVVTGQCGFSIAPCAEGDRDFLSGFFAAVEGMSSEMLRERLDWRFESFSELLQSWQGTLGINAACYVGHSSLRRFVMGEAASERAARPEEVQVMARLVGEAVAAGALGFSSCFAAADRDQFGRMVPSCYGNFEEVAALARVAGETGRGSIAFIPNSAIAGLDLEEGERLIELSLGSGLPVIIMGVGQRLGMRAQWERDLSFLARVRECGAAVYSTYRTQPYRRPFDWQLGTSIFDGLFEWRDLSTLPPEERLRRFADPDGRPALREGLDHPNTDGARGATLPPPDWDRVFVTHSSSDAAAVGRSVTEIARGRGLHVADVFCELAGADGLSTGYEWSTESEAWVQATAEAMREPGLLVGTGDCGAHADRDDGAEWSTYFLSRWLLEREIFSLEEGVRRITHLPAHLLGLRDRGLIAPGYWADLMLFDPERLSLGRKQRVADLSPRAPRWQVEVEGVARVMVNGETLVEAGEVLDPRPGQVLSPG